MMSLFYLQALWSHPHGSGLLTSPFMPVPVRGFNDYFLLDFVRGEAHRALSTVSNPVTTMKDKNPMADMV